MIRTVVAGCALFSLCIGWRDSADGAELRAGFATAEITPAVEGAKPVYLAGYGMGRTAEGVHDPLFARTVVLASGEKRVAIVSVDLVGLQYPQVKAIRAKLPHLNYVLVSSTHNHEGPDVIGIWGRNPFHRGVDEEYLELVVERVVESIRAAEKSLVPVSAAFGTAEDETLVGDSRQPFVKDGAIRVVRFQRPGSSDLAGLMVVWSCHPESLGSKNKLITADFPWATVAALQKRHKCPVVYLSGAVGGLMAPPDGRIHDSEGKEIKDGNFEYARRYGEEVANLADKALAAAEPIELTPFAISAKAIAVPVENSYYKAARALGVLQRDGIPWTGNFDDVGPPQPPDAGERLAAVESEVAYLRLGDLHVAGVPGEIYPELVYGKFQEPADPGADFPDAPLEPSVAALLSGKRWLLIGLANDELGYIIPKRQWDAAAPFAYGRTKSQYGEINSCGPDVAPILMRALQARIDSAHK
ncbi:MAG TPA: neutral/alkaline non-lysosomal ceramidase N-terminal domain-containing protein [Pirellulaceae bacterium]|nr:neutral/alkaline non-lysosomal ceramidase N-terminal domain-containing protein [Pirellulaceae bacterium]